jgi:hypothetical protein
MAFDPIDYVPPSPPPPRPKAPKLTPAGERLILILLALLVVALFVLPISAATFVDILRYIGA